MNDDLYNIQETLYDEILKLYYELVTQTDKKRAMDLIISSLAINLGSILSQVPEEYRSSYQEITLKILNESIAAGVEDNDKIKWGQIGHA